MNDKNENMYIERKAEEQRWVEYFEGLLYNIQKKERRGRGACIIEEEIVKRKNVLGNYSTGEVKTWKVEEAMSLGYEKKVW